MVNANQARTAANTRWPRDNRAPTRRSAQTGDRQRLAAESVRTVFMSARSNPPEMP